MLVNPLPLPACHRKTPAAFFYVNWENKSGEEGATSVWFPARINPVVVSSAHTECWDNLKSYTLPTRPLLHAQHYVNCLLWRERVGERVEVLGFIHQHSGGVPSSGHQITTSQNLSPSGSPSKLPGNQDISSPLTPRASVQSGLAHKKI